jgi:hypothetical protein
MWRKVVAGILTATLVGGGIAVEDIASADLVATLNDPITLNEAMKFRAPSHHVEVSDNGLIELVVGGDKRYGIMPTRAADNSKGLFLTIASKEQEATIKDAFGTGSEIIVKNTPRSFSKVVSFTEDFLKDIPEDAEFVEVSFDLSGWNVPDGTYTERVQLQQDVWLEKALAWDSSEGDPNQNYTDVEFVIENGTLTKRIPVEWLKTAVFPIYTDATFTFGTKELADAGPSSYVATVPIGTDKATLCWTDSADTAVEGECLISSVSGTDLTFGSVFQFADDINSAVGDNFDTCAAGDDRWVVVYNEDLATEDSTMARIASSTGTVINGFGTASTLTASTTGATCVQVDTDTIVFSYSNNTIPNSNRTTQAKACTISADYTLTCGSAVTLEPYSTSAGQDNVCAKLDTNKFICSYQSGVSGSFLRLGAGTVSGTTITLGATTTINGGTANEGHNIISPTTDKFAVHWTESSAVQQRFALGTVSGTIITLGATTTAIIATTTSFSSIVSIDTNSAFLYYQQGATDAATTFLAAIPTQLNWSTLTFSTSSAETVDATTDPGSLHAAKIGECKILFAWEDDNDTNDLFAKVATCASSFSPWQFMDW